MMVRATNARDRLNHTEAAKILGVSRQRVHQFLAEHPTFPALVLE
jgi:DNA-directed RNA polymerase specialized sigma subunit